MTKYYATRSAIGQPGSDYDAAMAHQQRGPFASATEARNDLAKYFAEGVVCAHPGIPQYIAEDFVSQYLGFLTAMAADPTGTTFEHEGVRWVIRSV